MRKNIWIIIVLIVIIIGIFVGILFSKTKNNTKEVNAENIVENNQNENTNTNVENVEQTNSISTNEVQNNETNTQENKQNSTSTETFEDTPKTQEEKAIQIVKKDYGETQNVKFGIEGMDENGRQIVTVRNPETTQALAFYFVNVSDGTFTKKEMN